MGRIIGDGVKNQLVLKDPFSGDPIIIYYRIPNSEERIAYESAKYRREKDRFEFCLSEARLKFGEKIIEGFEEGSFLHKIEGAGNRPFSSDPESPNYDPSWKELLRKYAPDVLEILAEHAFDSLRTVASQGEFSEKNL
jgi:hypothetical protein